MSERAYAYWVAAQLMGQSDYHRDWGVEEFRRCIQPPIEEQQYILGCYDEEPVIFATYAFPDQCHIDEYLDTGMFPRDGFYGMGNSPWIIDFICTGGMRDITNGFRYFKAMFRKLGYDNAQWLRTETNKRGFHRLKGK